MTEVLLMFIVHCYIPSLYADLKIKIPDECVMDWDVSGAIDAVTGNIQCRKKIEIWGRNFSGANIIEQFQAISVTSGKSEDSIEIRFKSKNDTREDYFLSLFTSDLPWINKIDEGGIFEFQIPDGAVPETFCGTYNPQKYGDNYEAW